MYALPAIRWEEGKAGGKSRPRRCGVSSLSCAWLRLGKHRREFLRRYVTVFLHDEQVLLTDGDVAFLTDDDLVFLTDMAWFS